MGLFTLGKEVHRTKKRPARTEDPTDLRDDLDGVIGVVQRLHGPDVIEACCRKREVMKLTANVADRVVVSVRSCILYHCRRAVETNRWSRILGRPECSKRVPGPGPEIKHTVAVLDRYPCECVFCRVPVSLLHSSVFACLGPRVELLLNTHVIELRAGVVRLVIAGRERWHRRPLRPCRVVSTRCKPGQLRSDWGPVVSGSAGTAVR